MQCETPNDIWGLWLFRWSSIGVLRDAERYWRIVIVSMIDYWCNARHRAIFEACDCISDRVLAYCETPNDIGGLWLYRWSIIDIMRDTERYLRLVIVSVIEYWCTARHRTIFEACACIDHRVLAYCETPNDSGDVIVSMIDYCYNARHRTIFKACACIEDWVLI